MSKYYSPSYYFFPPRKNVKEDNFFFVNPHNRNYTSLIFNKRQQILNSMDNRIQLTQSTYLTKMLRTYLYKKIFYFLISNCIFLIILRKNYNNLLILKPTCLGKNKKYSYRDFFLMLLYIFYTLIYICTMYTCSTPIIDDLLNKYCFRLD